MGRKRRSTSLQQTHLVKHYEMEVDGHLISKDDIIKIHGEHGVKFKFNCIVTNTHNDVQWVDCFELDKGLIRSWRSFRPEQVKRIPKRRKRVNRDRTDQSS